MHVYFRQGFAHHHHHRADRHPIFYERVDGPTDRPASPRRPRRAVQRARRRPRARTARAGGGRGHHTRLEQIIGGMNEWPRKELSSSFFSFLFLLLTHFDTHAVLSQVAVSGRRHC